LDFDRVGPLEPASGHAAFVLASDTDSFAIHPEIKVSEFEEFLNENYAGIPSIPVEGGNGTTQRRDV
jgi:hypothetical protein